ncbi:GDP-L-galactose phosphorylase 1-like [Quillaja saponaria]|uniref:GDP-D-glucose phosphorylase 1 n=1 Tax=Quillaja saponaria TaxID=32244 RepID=A0AAD7PLK3_QUISA|nr:GDP-L-galactose phosphorylase 1-like [Quillaja saponaria]
MNRGLFQYDVTTCETKIIPGLYGFIAQLNQGRHLKKRFEQSRDCKSHFKPRARLGKRTINVLSINVSPIEYGHVLLLPRVLHCLPQRIDHESFLLALHMSKEAADPFFRLGYSSLGAFITINHLHFEAYYLAAPFPVEKAPTQRAVLEMGLEHRGVFVSQLLNYPVRGLVFEGGNRARDLSDAVANACVFLQNNNIPFNVLVSDSGKRIFLFPQCFAEKQALGKVSQEILDTEVNPAVWEISGHIVLKRRKDFEDASEAYAWRLLSEVSLSEDRFQDVKTCILKAAGLHVAYVEEN